MSGVAQRSFAGGEISQALYARVDFVKYATGLRQMRNWSIMRSGGAQNRPGSTYDAEVGDSTKTVRLIPFVFNASQTYLLEFGDQYMRVHKNGALLTEASQAIVSIAAGNPAILQTVNPHGYSSGDEVYIAGVSGMTQVNTRNFRVGAIIDSQTFQLLNKDGSNFNATGFSLGTGGTVARVYQIATPYAYADLPAIRFKQSADVVRLTHPSYAPRELARAGDINWTLSVTTFAPTQAAPTGAVTGNPGGSPVVWYVVTAYSATGEESLPSNVASSTVDPGTAPQHVTWTLAAGAAGYNVYRGYTAAGPFLYAGSSATPAGGFIDANQTLNYNRTPPSALNPFASANNYPTAIAYYQQRFMLGNTNTSPENVWGSQTGNFKNFTSNLPIQDNFALSFGLVSEQVNSVQHMLDLGKLVVFSQFGESVLLGNAAGVLTPSSINPRTRSYYGSGTLRPLAIGANAIFLQARGNIVRDLFFDVVADGFHGNDLTQFADHLFGGYTITDWAYAQIPNSIVWAVRSDGALLGLTYIQEQQMVGWHRHDTDGAFENVCVLPEGNEDAVYIVVRRTIGGATKRFIERFSTRQLSDIRDANFTDSAQMYDGRAAAFVAAGTVPANTTMALSGGTTWASTELLTLTCSSSFFSAADVGNAVQLTGADGLLVRFTIQSASSATVVRGYADRIVPASLRATATTSWVKAVTTVTGLWHLEGKKVAVFADGYVVASPNNAKYATLTVTNGSITLTRPYGVIRVGLPYTADLETLDLDVAQGDTLGGRQMLVNELTLHLQNARGLFAGGAPPTSDATDPLQGLTEVKPRGTEMNDAPPPLLTEKRKLAIQAQFNNNGRVFIRQVDPLPAAVLSIAPTGLIPVPQAR